MTLNGILDCGNVVGRLLTATPEVCAAVPATMTKKSVKKPEAVNINETKSALAKRRKLATHPLVMAELDRIWTAANFNDEDAVLDRQEYYTMHRKVCHDPSTRASAVPPLLPYPRQHLFE